MVNETIRSLEGFKTVDHFQKVWDMAAIVSEN